MTNFLDNHKQKCRCCFQNFTEQSQKVKITQKICRNFLAVVQIELQMSSSYSNFLCELCHNQLEKFAQFKAEAFDKQTQLYVSQRKTQGKRLHCDENDDEEPISDETVLIKKKRNEEFFVKEEFQCSESSIIIENYSVIEIKAEQLENHENTQDTESNDVKDSLMPPENIQYFSDSSSNSSPSLSSFKKQKTDKDFTCKVRGCNKVLKNKSSYWQHARDHQIRASGGLKCLVVDCNKKFLRKQKLDEHMKRSHPLQLPSG